MRVDDDLIHRIGKSEMFSEYQAAFEVATGLPLVIRPMEFWNLPHRNRRNENPFCAVMAQIQSYVCRVPGSSTAGD